MAYPGYSAKLWCQCSSRISAGAGVGRGSLKQPAIECLTLGPSRGMNGVTLPIVTLPIVTLGTIRPEDSEAARFKLHSETQVSGRLGMSGGKSPRNVQNPLSGEGGKRSQ